MRNALFATLLIAGTSLCVLTSAQAVGQIPGSPEPRPNTPTPRTTGTTDETIPNSTLGADPSRARMDDHKFVKEAALGGMANVAIGKLAAEKASSDAVKQFGQKVADEHAKSNDELRKVAAKKSVGLPDSLDSKHQARVDKLAKLSGPEFDRAFLKDQTKNHQQSIKDFEAESENGTDPDVKAFASKTLPTLQQHLSLAKNLSKNKAAPVAEVR